MGSEMKPDYERRSPLLSDYPMRKLRKAWLATCAELGADSQSAIILLREIIKRQIGFRELEAENQRLRSLVMSLGDKLLILAEFLACKAERPDRILKEH